MKIGAQCCMYQLVSILIFFVNTSHFVLCQVLKVNSIVFTIVCKRAQLSLNTWWWLSPSEKMVMWSLNAFCVKAMKSDPQFSPR